MGNMCTKRITPEGYDFYLQKMVLLNEFTKNIHSRAEKKKKNNKLEECVLLMDFCVDLYAAVDECVYNRNKYYGQKLDMWRITLLNDLVYSYKLIFDKNHFEFLNASEEICINEIILGVSIS